LSDEIEKNELGGVSSTYGGQERCIQGLGGERRRWEDNIKMDLQEVRLHKMRGIS
jgi:hypothetical protein